jgi:predicted ATPase
MIKELKLINWKSFQEATLYIDPLTVVIGSNASGKSNCLDALLFLNRVSQGIAIFPAIAGDVNLTAIRGGMEWICRKPEKEFTISVVFGSESTSKEDYRYNLTVLVNGTKAEVYAEELTLLTYGHRSEKPGEQRLFRTKQEESNSPGIPTYFFTGTQGRGKRHDLNRANIILSQVETLNVKKEIVEGVKLVLSQLQKIFVFDPIPSHMRNYTPLSEKLLADGSNIAGVLAGLGIDRKQIVEETLTRYLKDLPERDIKRIWTEPVGKFKTDAMLYCEEGWENQPTHEVDARGMSDGTLRYLAIVTALLTREPGSLLVIEEVDNGLHPSRAHLLVEMLKTLGKERTIDVLVTTHNPALLDAAGVGMIPFIVIAHRDDATGFSRLTQLEDIDQLPKLIASGSLGTLSSKGRIEAALKREGE